MVLDDCLAALVARLSGDAFFSDPAKGVAVLAENRMDLSSELDTQLARLGMVLVVAITNVAPDQIGADHGCVIVETTAVAMEVPFINRADSGTQKTAQQILVKLLSLWGRPWSPDRDAWSPSEFAGYVMSEANADNASITWQIKFNWRTCLETVVPCFEVGDGKRVFVNQDGENVYEHPTDP